MKASASNTARDRTRVLLADDHRIVREGLKALLAQEPDMDVVGLACDGQQAVRMARECQPDVLVTDLSMPGLNGVETIKRVHAEHPGMRLLCLSMHDDSRTVLSVLTAGASGYVLKDSSSEELALAIRRLMAGKVYVSPELMDVVVGGLRQPAAEAAQSAVALTPRERELVQLLSEGYSTNEVAERLHISIKTVATHREHVMRKLQLNSLAELTRYALREGLSTLDTPCLSALKPRSAAVD